MFCLLMSYQNSGALFTEKKKNNNDKKYDILPKMPFPVQADGNVLVRHYSLQFVKLGPTDLEK